MQVFSRDDYTVGWISAKSIELAAARAVLEKEHNRLPPLDSDRSIYVLGEINNLKIVITCLPSGDQGHIPAASVARDMQSAFPKIRFWLLVGIGGGVPTERNDIRLGDVVVSNPSNTDGGVIQYDFGKAMQHGKFERTGVLAKPSDFLRSAVAHLSAAHILRSSSIHDILADVQNKTRAFTFPGRLNDRLFETEYVHPTTARTCQSCDQDRLMHRIVRETDDPKIFYGLIATGNQVMRDAVRRDQLAQELNILCFEMEAAGLMDCYSCLVIRGISDYADSHKNDDWQPYAATTAAAYAKELLSTILPAPSNIPILRDNSLNKANKTPGAKELNKILHERALQTGWNNYQTSILDLLKLLDLDSSKDARRQYANILNIHVGPDGSDKQNRALHREIMEQYSKSGSRVVQMLKLS